MANYSTALYVKAQAQLQNAMQSPEFRYTEPAIHNLFMENGALMLPNFDELKLSRERVVETNYLKFIDGANDGAPTHNHTGTQDDSGVLTPTFTPVSRNMVSYLKEHNSKIFTREQMHMQKLNARMISLANINNGLASDYLFANKTAVNVATADGVWDAVDSTFEITEATLGEDALAITQMVMEVNKYEGAFDIVCDPVAFRKFVKLSSQGTMNATNTAYQFSPDMRFILDISLTAKAAGLVSAYANGYWIVVPRATIGALTFIPKQNRDGYVSSDNMYGQIQSGIDGVNYALHTYENRADGSANGGSVQDLKMETQIWADISYVHAPLSVVGATSIHGFAFV